MSEYSVQDAFRVPGLLSMSRLPLAIAFAVTLGDPRWSLGALLLAGVSDVLDGFIARRFGQATPTGAWLDAVMDKLFVGIIALALVASHAVTLLDVLLLGVRDIGEALIAARLAMTDRARLARRHAPNLLGKATTALQYVAVALAVLRSEHVRVFVIATAIAGVFATVSYWRSERPKLA